MKHLTLRSVNSRYNVEMLIVNLRSTKALHFQTGKCTPETYPLLKVHSATGSAGRYLRRLNIVNALSAVIELGYINELHLQPLN